MSGPHNFAFVHGGGQGGWVWSETIAALYRQTGEGSARAIALDAPGCGLKRDQPTDDLTIADVACELIADIEHAQMDDVVLVGHSQAGQAMAFMVEARPNLFRRLVHVSCSIPLPGQTVVQMMGRGVHGSDPGEIGWPLDPLVNDVSAQYPVMFCNDMDEDQAQLFLSRLGAEMWPRQTYAFTGWGYDHLEAVPATYVLCLRDQSLPPRWQRVFAGRLKADDIVHLDAGHQAMNTRPEALAEILLHEANRSAGATG